MRRLVPLATWWWAVAAGCIGMTVGLGSRAWHPGPSAAALAQSPRSAEPGTDERRHAELHGRYAAARLLLALAQLDKARALGKTFPGQVSQREIRSLEREAEVLRAHVDVTQRSPHGNAPTLARCMARAARLQADEDLAAAHAANEHHAGTVSRETIGVLEARAEVAAIRLALWEDPAFLDTPLAALQMQIDQLADQVLDLAQRIDNAPAMNRR